MDQNKTSKKLLIIDNNERYAQTLSEEMEARGYIVRWVIDGVSALEITEDYIPDVILLSLDLEEIPAIKILEALRNNPELTEALFVVQSKSDSKKVQAACNKVSPHYYFLRPVKTKTLEKLLNLENVVERICYGANLWFLRWCRAALDRVYDRKYT